MSDSYETDAGNLDAYDGDDGEFIVLPDGSRKYIPATDNSPSSKYVTKFPKILGQP